MFFWNTPVSSGPRGMNEACSLVQRLSSLSEIPQFLRRYITRAM